MINGAREPLMCWPPWEAPWVSVTSCAIPRKVRHFGFKFLHVVSSADGLPAVFNNNGLQWFIPYLLAITLLAIPVLILEVSVGQSFRGYVALQF